jgi:hypothetical protein
MRAQEQQDDGAHAKPFANANQGQQHNGEQRGGRHRSRNLWDGLGDGREPGTQSHVDSDWNTEQSKRNLRVPNNYPEKLSSALATF